MDEVLGRDDHHADRSYNGIPITRRFGLLNPSLNGSSNYNNSRSPVVGQEDERGKRDVASDGLQTSPTQASARVSYDPRRK